MNKLINIDEPNLKDLKYSMESLKDLVMKTMEKDGWSTTLDNRFLARRRRQSLSNN